MVYKQNFCYQMFPSKIAYIQTPPFYLRAKTKPVNLTTDDEYTCCVTLAACYQLAQSILKVDFVLAKKVG